MSTDELIRAAAKITTKFDDDIKTLENHIKPFEHESGKVSQATPSVIYEIIKDAAKANEEYFNNLNHKSNDDKDIAMPPSNECPNSWIKFENHCYQNFTKKTFVEAEATCQSYDSHLVSIHSYAEAHFVSRKFFQSTLKFS